MKQTQEINGRTEQDHIRETKHEGARPSLHLGVALPFWPAGAPIAPRCSPMPLLVTCVNAGRSGPQGSLAFDAPRCSPLLFRVSRGDAYGPGGPPRETQGSLETFGPPPWRASAPPTPEVLQIMLKRSRTRCRTFDFEGHPRDTFSSRMDPFSYPRGARGGGARGSTNNTRFALRMVVSITTVSTLIALGSLTGSTLRPKV